MDAHIESLREDGLTGEDAAEALFVFGCYLGEVMVRHLGGAWVPTARSPLRDVSPWPMVVVLPDGSAWDPIGKAYRRLELGDSEYLPAFFAAAAAAQGTETDGLSGEPTTAGRRFPSPASSTCMPSRPRDIPSVVEEYVRACRERGILALRLVHGRGRGVQRAVVRRVLARLDGGRPRLRATLPPERGALRRDAVREPACARCTDASRQPSSVF